MSETTIQPQKTETDWPSVRVMYIVVLSPKGTAMMANDLLCVCGRLVSPCIFCWKCMILSGMIRNLVTAEQK